MNLTHPIVYSTVNDDGSADFTICYDERMHKFSVAGENGEAVVSYEESLTPRGKMQVAEPPNEVFKRLMQHRLMTEYLEEHDIEHVKRER